MLLCIDIGNTNVVIGLLKESEVLYRWRLDSHTRRTEDEWYLLLKTLFHNEELSFDKIKGTVISSVVPSLTPFFRKMSKKYIGIDPIVISGEMELGIKILYEDPLAVGADRICNAIAGFKKYGGPLIIIDFGTATTYDIIDEVGSYVGGIIAPGLETAARYLHSMAAKLPSVELVFPETIVARNTEMSMQSGIMYSTLDAVNGIVLRINNELKCECNVIVTGGIGELMHDKIGYRTSYEPNLTLLGMEIIFNYLSMNTDQ